MFEYKVDMARTGKKVGRPAKKDLAGVRRQAKAPKVKRTRYLLRTKLKAVELHESGMRLKAIRQWFIDNEGIYIQKPTICTWINPETIRKLKELGDMCEISNETCINSKQRPRILMDLEQILKEHVKRSQENGLPLSFLPNPGTLNLAQPD